jgi:uncharacterized Tic20 family protein
MSENSTPTYTSEERILAAVSHASVIMFGWGLIVPVIVWITQREKSRFASFQALQTLAYQLTQIIVYQIVYFLAMIPFFGFIFITILLTESKHAEPSPYLVFIGVLLLFLIIFGSMGLYVLIGLVGAVACIGGKDFRYPILGNWIARYLTRVEDEEEGEDE